MIFHIDVNSAFLSWTAIKLLKEGNDLDIRKVPAIVGGDQEKRHGVVLAKSISAKKYGIKTGEPVARALEKCPELIMVPPVHDYYEGQSRKFITLLSEYTPDIEQVSIDECYMDFAGISNEFESPQQAAYIIKERIKDELGFTVNIGISDKKILAKMASDFTKPDKIHTLFTHEIENKMWPMPVEELFMAGHASVDIMHKLGIYTIGQLANTPEHILVSHLKSHGKILWEYANGIDETKVETTKEEAKGIGNSTTLPYDFDSIDEINKVLLQLSEKVGGRLRKAKQKAKTIAVEIKYNDFSKVSHQMTVSVPVSNDTEIFELSKRMFEHLWNGQAVRLLGVRSANLVDMDEPEQMSMFDIMNNTNSGGNKNISREKMKKLDKALDKIKSKYGGDAISRASLLNDKKIQKH